VNTLKVKDLQVLNINNTTIPSNVNERSVSLFSGSFLFSDARDFIRNGLKVTQIGPNITYAFRPLPTNISDAIAIPNNAVFSNFFNYLITNQNFEPIYSSLTSIPNTIFSVVKNFFYYASVETRTLYINKLNFVVNPSTFKNYNELINRNYPFTVSQIYALDLGTISGGTLPKKFIRNKKSITLTKDLLYLIMSNTLDNDLAFINISYTTFTFFLVTDLIEAYDVFEVDMSVLIKSNTESSISAPRDIMFYGAKNNRLDVYKFTVLSSTLEDDVVLTTAVQVQLTEQLHYGNAIRQITFVETNYFILLENNKLLFGRDEHAVGTFIEGVARMLEDGVFVSSVNSRLYRIEKSSDKKIVVSVEGSTYSMNFTKDLMVANDPQKKYTFFIVSKD
jgi:hypothetical protein